MISERKILELIQSLASYSDAEDVEFDVMKKRKITKREKRMGKCLMDIYRFSHAQLQFGVSGCKHPDWLKDAEELYLKFLKNNQL